MLGYGIAIGVVIGLAAGVFLVRYGMGLGEKMTWAARDGIPALHEYDKPLAQANTSGESDMTVEG